MKSIINKSMALVAICSALLSFSSKPGGEGFEIFLNNKLLLQRFGSDVNTVKSIQLEPGSTNDQLIIKYYHCGKAGKNRYVTIKDEQDKVLKQFHYTDAATPVTAISVPVKDIMNLKKGNVVLKLYYSSAELPNGRMLASINMTGTNTARL